MKSHNFRQYGLGTGFWGPQPQQYLYALENGSEDSKIEELIFLGQTLRDTPGIPFKNNTPKTWESYSQKQKQRDNFGNIFLSLLFSRNKIQYTCLKHHRKHYFPMQT